MIINLGEVLLSIQVLVLLHHRFANATQVSSKNSRWKVFKKGMKIHIDVSRQSVFFNNLSYSIG